MSHEKEDDDRLEARAQEANFRKKTKEANNTREDKKRIIVKKDEGPEEKEEQDDSTTDSRGAHTTTYEEIIRSVSSDSGSESQDSSSTSTEEEQQEQPKDDYESRVEEYINEISEGHEKYDKTERMLRNIPPKVPRKWMFEKIHENQIEKWETAASLRGWLIEQIHKNRGDLDCIKDWLTTVNKILTDFFEFKTTEGLETLSEGLYQRIWDFYKNNRDPLDKIGDLYE